MSQGHKRALILLLETRVTRNLVNLGGWGKAHKMSGMEEGENWSKLRSWPGELLLTLCLILEGEMQLNSFWLE